MQKQIAIFLFSLISVNIIYLPAANATVGNLETKQLYALGGLALIIFGLIFYLFDVIVRPERY